MNDSSLESHRSICPFPQLFEWGVREWTETEWLWISGAFDDGSAYNHLTFWLPDFPEQRYINGFWYDGASVEPLTDAAVAASPAFGEEMGQS